MAATPVVKIQGLSEFARSLRQMDADLPKALRLALNESASVIVDYARVRVPRKTGRARDSVKAQSTRTLARVVGGSKRVPYYAWLDFGGKVGKSGPTRPFLKRGRYIYQGYYANREKFVDALQDALVKVAKDAGIEVE